MSFKQWEEVDWAKVENRILRIQKRIYQASKLGNKGKVVYLQNLLLKSLDAKLLAVRKVTTENKGRKTPGVDQIVYIKPEQKIKIIQNISLTLIFKSVSTPLTTTIFVTNLTPRKFLKIKSEHG